MGLFSFLADAGRKLFGGHKEADAGQPVQALNPQQLDIIRNHVTSLGLKIDQLNVSLNAPGEITLTGVAATRTDYEKAALMAGNVMGISKVNNQMTVAPQPVPEPESQTYEIKKGDTLWAIAKHYYGDGNRYPDIVAANQPMIKDADEIYPGQVLRIPQKSS